MEGGDRGLKRRRDVTIVPISGAAAGPVTMSGLIYGSISARYCHGNRTRGIGGLMLAGQDKLFFLFFSFSISILLVFLCVCFYFISFFISLFNR